MTPLIDLIQSIRIPDVIDIALLAVVIYWMLLLIKGTRTIPILLGLSILLATYILSSFLELEAIGWLMENLFASTVVILVVLFQGDIRNALARLGMTTLFRELPHTTQQDVIDEVAQAATAMAARRVGASIVMEKEASLQNYIERSKPINAPASADLLEAIFQRTSPLHDGAVIIGREGTIAAARCILPLTSNPATSAFLGTRHRSALGLSEETDAVIVVVSEERGHISLAHHGQLQRDLNEQALRQQLFSLLSGRQQTRDVTGTPTQSSAAQI